MELLITDWTEKLAPNYSYDICCKSFRFISAKKSDTFVVKFSNDICLKILSLGITEWTDKLAPNFSYDICGKSFRFISAENSDTFVVKVSNDNCLKILSFVITDWSEKLWPDLRFGHKISNEANTTERLEAKVGGAFDNWLNWEVSTKL